MQNEYLFVARDPLEFPLDESINVQTDIPNDGHYIVANVETEHAEIYAYEVNYYLRNTEDALAEQIPNVKKLYDIRSHVYDLQRDMDYTQEVGQKVLIVSEKTPGGIEELLGREKFTVITLRPEEVTQIEGHIGQLRVTTTKLLRGALESDQIIWEEAPSFAMLQSGVVDPAVVGWEQAMEAVRKNSGAYHYKNYVQYDSTICQYHERTGEEICGKCEAVCPTVAILKIDDERHLSFSDIDCEGCGGCVSVCPSGALDFTQMPREAFWGAASFYAGHTALILPHQVSLPDVPLPEGVLPLGIEGRKFLTEAHLLALLQKSGNPVIFYTDFVSKGTTDAIRIINEIFERKYHKKAVYVCSSEAQLREALIEKVSLEMCRFDMEDATMRKRESFTHRLAHLVGEDDLGVVTTGQQIQYGDLVIHEEACTLCMSCVGACNVAALTAHPEDNTLRLNASICTNCGYCEVVCPETDCLSVTDDTLALKPEYFKQRVMAQDSLFACVECGKEFAPTKAVEKIAAMMTPMFGDDAVRIRTLYCCEECKPKVMFRDHIDHKIKGRG